jgi:hypothetical protein
LPLFPLQDLVDCCFFRRCCCCCHHCCCCCCHHRCHRHRCHITIAVVVAVLTAVIVAATNVSHPPLTAPPSCCLAQAGCCVASSRNALSSSRCAALSSYCRHLTSPPSCCLISPAGCCVASRCTALSSSSHSTALVVLRRLVVASLLVAPPSRHATLSSSPLPLTAPPSHCLISTGGCCVASCHAALSLSSYSFALSSSCTGWLLRRLLLCRPLVLSSSSTLNSLSLGSWTHLMQYSYGIVHQTVEKVERRRDKGGGRK